MNILLVEDEIHVLDYLEKNLSTEGYTVLGCHTPTHFMDLMENKSFVPDVIILDRMLENTDSSFLIQKIKKSFQEAKIIILSAINTPSERVKLLDLGVHDYIGKPFSLAELQARVRVQMRSNSSIEKSEFFVLGDLLINTHERTISHKGNTIDLTNKEYLLLHKLIQNEKKVFNKFQLLDYIWQSNINIESNVVEVTVMNIRKKLEEAGSKVSIHSRRNIGYWIET